MTFAEIQREVKYAVKDSRADILLSIPDFINEAYVWFTSEMSISSMKTLFTIDTVVSQAHANFPSTFDGRLVYLGTSDEEITILDGGLDELIHRYPTMTEVGSVEYAAVEGSILWYQPIPVTATTLTCVGFRYPVELSADSDVPTDIPLHLHRDLLVNKACELAYARIEEGLEGEKPNTMFYMNQVEAGKAKLQTWLTKRKINVGRSVWGV